MGELAKVWYERLIADPVGAMQRIGSSMLGQGPYTAGDINPAMVGDAMEAVGAVSAPQAFGSQPMASKVSAFGAFHGSPHKFDKFTTAKMGTGEGVQAFGHGLYFTDKKEVAKHYAHTLSDRIPIRDVVKVDGKKVNSEVADLLYGTWDKDKSVWQKRIESDIKYTEYKASNPPNWPEDQNDSKT